MAEQPKVIPKTTATFPESEYAWVWGEKAFYPFETFLQTIVSPYASMQLRFAGKPTREAVEATIESLRIVFEVLPTEEEIRADLETAKIASLSEVD